MKLSELCPVPLPPANLPSEVLIGPGVLDEVEAVAARHMSADRLILADPDTWRAVGEPSLTGTRLLLEPHPHADDETVARVVDAMKDRSGIVAVGSGTINDLAKRAESSFKAGKASGLFFSRYFCIRFANFFASDWAERLDATNTSNWPLIS